jgi:hypothetical protein
LLDAENQIHLRANAACTGATTSDVASGQLSALKQGTRLVTLTVGAADLGLSRVLAACTAGTPAQCQEAIRLANLLLPAECGDESELGRRLGKSVRGCGRGGTQGTHRGHWLSAPV